MNGDTPSEYASAERNGVLLDATVLQSLNARLVVDTSERHPVHLLVGRNGVHLRLSAAAATLLRHVAQGVSFERLAEIQTAREARQVSAAEVEAAYRRIVERITTIEAQGKEARGAFWLRFRLIPASWVGRIATRCSAAFRPSIAALLLAAIIAGTVITWRIGVHLRPEHFWQAYALFIVSLIAHELGHASACARFGATPSEIGFSMYLLFPALYSDVNATWSLKRRHRVIVDLGGVYFQLVVGVVYAVVFALSRSGPFEVALIFISGSCLFSLNPILKFDGYWVVADALGVTNLSRQPARILRHSLNRLRGRPTRPLPWSGTMTLVLAVYAVLSFGFWAWFLQRLLFALVPHALQAARRVIELVDRLRETPHWPGTQLIADVITSVYILLFACIMLWRLLWALLILVRNRVVRGRLGPEVAKRQVV